MSQASGNEDSAKGGESAEKPATTEEQDAELRFLTAKRMIELRKKMSYNLQAQKKKEEEKGKPPARRPPTDREVLLAALVERGDEVFYAAEAGYPKETAILVPRLASLIRTRKVTTISGGELLQFFRSIGMRVSVKTSISVQEHGKFVSLSEKLKQQRD